MAAFEFGFSKGNIVTGIGLPVGKALTGLAAGYVFMWFKESKFSNYLTTVVSYIPEAILTFVLFKYLLPPATGIPEEIAVASVTIVDEDDKTVEGADLFVYEKYQSKDVKGGYRTKYRLIETHVNRSDSTFSLKVRAEDKNRNGYVRYPDFWKDEFIVDAKYKRLENKEIDRNDSN